MLVSVIIPTYNRWPMVGEAVESVLAQDFRDFELIVIDDGSTDGTSSELERYSGLTLLRQPRRGVSAARNFGVTHARGKYIAFLDSDDCWLPTKLREQVAYLASNPGLQLCQTEEIWIRHGVRVNPKFRHRKPSGDIFRPSLELCLVSPSAVMMTRDLFYQAGGFDETLPVCEDYDLWLRIAIDHPVGLIETPLVIKRGGHADQLSRSVWGMDRYRIVALRKLLGSGRLTEDRKQWVVETLRRKTAIVANGARKRGRLEHAAALETALRELVEDWDHVGGADTSARSRAGISPADG